MPVFPQISRRVQCCSGRLSGTDLLPRALVGLGIAATIAQNVAAGSRGGYGGALMGVLPPAGMLLALETLIWMVRRLAARKGGLWWCAGAGLPLACLAGIAGVISYLHSLAVARWTAAPGEVGASLTEHLLPLVADLMIATGSVALVALARSRARPSHSNTASQKTGSSKDGSPKTVPQRTPAGAGCEETGRSNAARRQPSRSAGKKRPGRKPASFPPVPPERLPRLLAMTERELAAELSRISGEYVTRWTATQFKKQHAVSPDEAVELAPEPVPASAAHTNGSGPGRED